MALTLLPALANTMPARLPKGRAVAKPNPPSVMPQPAMPVADSQIAKAAPAPAPASFERYAVILARMPFGDETAAAALAAASAAASQPAVDSFTKNLKMSAITRSRLDGKIQVGIVDTVTKKNYFLFEGDSEDGIQVVKADYEKEKALLKKGAEEAWMDMNAPTVVVSAGRPGAAVAVAPIPAVRKVRESRVIPIPPPPESPFKTPEELQNHLKSYQMELIRAGGKKGPPLPMELTPEMDAQLVEEGVLAAPAAE